MGFHGAIGKKGLQQAIASDDSAMIIGIIADDFSNSKKGLLLMIMGILDSD